MSDRAEMNRKANREEQRRLAAELQQERARVCRTCRYFEGWPRADGEGVGVCRRYPPNHLGSVVRAIQLSEPPMVWGEGWCGEWGSGRAR